MTQTTLLHSRIWYRYRGKLESPGKPLPTIKRRNVPEFNHSTKSNNTIFTSSLTFVRQYYSSSTSRDIVPDVRLSNTTGRRRFFVKVRLQCVSMRQAMSLRTSHTHTSEMYVCMYMYIYSLRKSHLIGG